MTNRTLLSSLRCAPSPQLFKAIGAVCASLPMIKAPAPIFRGAPHRPSQGRINSSGALSPKNYGLPLNPTLSGVRGCSPHLSPRCGARVYKTRFARPCACARLAWAVRPLTASLSARPNARAPRSSRVLPPASAPAFVGPPQPRAPRVCVGPLSGLSSRASPLLASVAGFGSWVGNGLRFVSLRSFAVVASPRLRVIRRLYTQIGIDIKHFFNKCNFMKKSSIAQRVTASIRGTYKKPPTQSQLMEIGMLQEFIALHKHRPNVALLSRLEEIGYTPQWLRVRWVGGVGSYSSMRGGVVRMLVTATKSGYKDSIVTQSKNWQGIISRTSTPPQRKGYRYGWCVEI